MLPLTPSGSQGALTFPSTPGSQPPPPALTCSQPQMALSHPRPPPHLRLLETPAIPGAHPSEVPHYPSPLRPTPPAHLAPHTCVLSYLPWLRMLGIASPPPTLLVRPDHFYQSFKIQSHKEGQGGGTLRGRCQALRMNGSNKTAWCWPERGLRQETRNTGQGAGDGGWENTCYTGLSSRSHLLFWWRARGHLGRWKELSKQTGGSCTSADGSTRDPRAGPSLVLHA